MSTKKQLDDSLKEHLISLYDRNYKVFDITKMYNITRKTVYNIVNRNKSAQTIKRKNRLGRKRNSDTWQNIKQIVDESPNLSLTQISAILAAR